MLWRSLLNAIDEVKHVCSPGNGFVEPEDDFGCVANGQTLC